jgi:hypothetical protein
VKRLHFEIAIRDFPTWSKPLIGEGHVERYPEESGFNISGFPESSALRKLKLPQFSDRVKTGSGG